MADSVFNIQQSGDEFAPHPVCRAPRRAAWSTVLPRPSPLEPSIRPCPTADRSILSSIEEVSERKVLSVVDGLDGPYILRLSDASRPGETPVDPTLEILRVEPVRAIASAADEGATNSAQFCARVAYNDDMEVGLNSEIEFKFDPTQRYLVIVDTLDETLGPMRFEFVAANGVMSAAQGGAQGISSPETTPAASQPGPSADP